MILKIHFQLNRCWTACVVLLMKNNDVARFGSTGAFDQA